MLNPQKTISEIIKHVKGGSSHRINEHDVIREKFAWQTGYAAYSVSESVLEKVYLYIHDQKQHHHKKTFTQEYDEFMILHGLRNQNG